MKIKQTKTQSTLSGEKRAQNGEIVLAEELQSDATKQTLRESEFVKIRNASAGWGANIVDAMKKISPQFRAKLREQSEYKTEIDDLKPEDGVLVNIPVGLLIDGCVLEKGYYTT